MLSSHILEAAQRYALDLQLENGAGGDAVGGG